jgi:hypothetical protein
MPRSTWPDPAADPSRQPTTELHRLASAIPDETPSPPSEAAEDEDPLYGDGDDAQSFIQPLISPVATRLSLSRARISERAAAMERLQAEGPFDDTDGDGEVRPRHAYTETIPKLQLRNLTDRRLGEGAAAPSPRPPQRSHTVVTRLPSPWHSGPKDFVVEDLERRKPVLSRLSIRPTRYQRASSFGDNAFRRLSKAIDSVNLPNIGTPSFFSSHSKDDHSGSTPTALARSQLVPHKAPVGQSPAHTSRGPQRQATETSDSSALQRTLSDDSELYHSLSRVSSFGDDDRWTHIREQVNVRMKAIKDSWDAPTFKLPSKCHSPRDSMSSLLTINCRHLPRFDEDRCIAEQFVRSPRQA